MNEKNKKNVFGHEVLKRLAYAINDILSISATDLSRKMGYVAPSTVYPILNGKLPLRGYFIDKFLKTFPEFNKEWLINGNGAPVTNDKQYNPSNSLNNSVLDSEVLKRIESILDFIGINVSELSRKMGYVSPSTIYPIFSGKLPLKPYFIKKLLEAFPSINKEWVITGEGEMFLTESEQKSLPFDENLGAEAELQQALNKIGELETTIKRALIKLNSKK